MFILNTIFSQRKIRIIIALLSLSLLLTGIDESYAKYISSATAKANFTISRWNILINNQDIFNKSNFSSKMIPTFDENENIKSNVLAPTSKGQVQINIDATKTDVSFKETLTFGLSSDTNISDLMITGYKYNDDEVVNFTEQQSTYTIELTHSKNDSVKTDNFIIYFEWYEGEGEKLDNDGDTSLTVNGVAKLNVSANFIQLAG